MNKQRLQSYVNLIQQLLACPSGEEWILLRQNEALVTPELVQIMEQVAAQLSHQGDIKEAKFLHNLAGQIHHLFVAQTVRPADHDDQTQAYLDVIQALLECDEGQEAEVLEAHQELIGPGLVQTMHQVASQLSAGGDQKAAYFLQEWATKLGYLWLKQHKFQPVQKKETELKPIPDLEVPVAPKDLHRASASSPSLQSPQTTSTLDEDDPWSESSPVAKELETLPISTSSSSFVENVASTPNPETTAVMATNQAVSMQINRNLEAIAQSLVQLREALTSTAQSPSDPLWYMETLERACAGNWILTSGEIQQLIGVKPSCPKNSNSFQRGCWVFVKAGKLGGQTAWSVQKTGDSAT